MMADGLARTRACLHRQPRSGPGYLLAVGLVLALRVVLGAASEGASGLASAQGDAASADALYQRYRAVVERNIFSRFARSARPTPPPEAEREAPETPPPPTAFDPGADYVLTGVVTGSEVHLALVEETSTGETRVYRVGTETPAGSLQAIEVDGVTLVTEDGPHLIRVGYTLSGERSEKLGPVVSSLGGGTPTAGQTSASEGPRLPSRGERSSASSRLSAARREEIIRRMREGRRREFGRMGPGR